MVVLKVFDMRHDKVDYAVQRNVELVIIINSIGHQYSDMFNDLDDLRSWWGG